MLRIYQVAREMVKRVERLADEIGRYDWDQARQLKRAAKSCKDNIAEGSGVRDGNRRVHYLRSMGSAKEARSNLETGVDCGYIAFDPIADDQLDHIIATMFNLTRR